MLSKKDLSLLQEMFNAQRAEFKKDINGLQTEMKLLNEKIDNNTNDLIELITSGFNSHDSAFMNHEQRISHLEFLNK